MKFFLTILLNLLVIVAFGQSNPSTTTIQPDTLLEKILKTIPEEKHAEFTELYNKLTIEQKKEMIMLMDFTFSLPVSSKKELILNIDSNHNQILVLKNYFNKIVPSGYEIYIEFHPPEIMLDESIDLWVYKKNETNRYDVVFQEWNIELKSSKLDSLLRLTPITRKLLSELKSYLKNANCISIRNGEICEIGFARSGMGKYSYLIFDKPLNEEEKKEYNNGCTYIFYKENIVLEYGGGAIGTQCFPDKEK